MILLYILVPLGVVALDQLVKLWALHSLQSVETIPVIPQVFHLTYCENTGAAFSMFSGQRWLLLAVTVVLLAALIFALYKNYMKNLFGRLSLLFIIGGAIGNMLDRMLRGFVVDLFDFRLIQFPIFNVADVFLNVGVIMMVIYVLFLEAKLNKKENKGGDSLSDGGPGK